MDGCETGADFLGGLFGGDGDAKGCGKKGCGADDCCVYLARLIELLG